MRREWNLCDHQLDRKHCLVIPKNPYATPNSWAAPEACTGARPINQTTYHCYHHKQVTSR